MSDRIYENYSQAPSASEGTMPQDIQAEKSILSAMIFSPEVLEECVVALDESDFYLYSHKAIFRAINDLFDKGKPIDPISLADHLRSEGNLDKVGGPSYLLDLGSANFSLASWQNHVEILHRDATLRAIIEASSKICALAFDAPEDTKEVVDQAERMLLSVTNRGVRSSYSNLAEIMEQLYNDLGEQAESGSDTMGIETGFPGLDSRLLGLRGGQMVVIGARPGVGKTSFCLNLAVNAAEAGATVALFSLDRKASSRAWTALLVSVVCAFCAILLLNAMKVVPFSPAVTAMQKVLILSFAAWVFRLVWPSGSVKR